MLGEHLFCIQKTKGSIPFFSTKEEIIMDKIDRTTGLTTSNLVNRELILRLLDKSDELVIGYSKIVKRLGDAMNIKDYYKDDKYNFK